ncbi:hypothetical protein TKK_0019031 [Trichogramma kaykai]
MKFIALRDRLLEYLRSVASHPTTRLEVVETFVKPSQLNAATYPTSWRSMETDSCNEQTTIKRLLSTIYDEDGFVSVSARHIRGAKPKVSHWANSGRKDFASYFELIYGATSEKKVRDDKIIEYFFSLLVRRQQYLSTDSHSNIIEKPQVSFSKTRKKFARLTDVLEIFESIVNAKQVKVNIKNFIKTHIKYWPIVYFNEESDPSSWSKICEAEDKKEATIRPTMPLPRTANLLSFQGNKRPIAPHRPWDETEEQILSFYLPHESCGNDEVIKKEALALKEESWS